MPQPAVKLLESAKPLILCGVTAAGKDATSQYLSERSNFERVVTHTTRRPRPGEVTGRDYWFVGESDMEALIEQAAFIEVQVLNGDRVYGTSLAALELAASRGQKPLMIIDIHGAAKIAKVLPQIQPLFMIPPSSDVWMQRLGGRANMSDGEHDRRLHSAREELEFVLDNPAFVLIINQDLEQSAREIIRGAPTDRGTQAERRDLAKELLEYTLSSNI